MKEVSGRALFWAPRALGILFIAFVSMFALDVFTESRGFWQTLEALAMHLTPTFVMLAALAIAWKWEWAGTVLFVAAGMFFLSIVRGSWGVRLVFASPCFLTAWLFLVNWRHKRSRTDRA